VLVVALMLLVTPQAMAQKYTIDGNLSDWGITWDELRNGLYPNCNASAWLPNDGVFFIVEDNRDPRYGPAPGGYPTGVHIYGEGSNYQKYSEPKIAGNPPPIGGEYNDIEAMYVDEDSNYIYIAIIVSGGSFGDLALNLDGRSSTGGYGYEYGVLLHTRDGGTQFDIYYTPSDVNWNRTSFDAAKPGEINLSSNPIKVGVAEGNISIARDSSGDIRDVPPNWYYRNYIIELKIDKSDVGMSGKSLGDNVRTVLSKFHIANTGDCGNDFTPDFPIAEFLTILIPAGVVIGSVYYFRKRNH